MKARDGKDGRDGRIGDYGTAAAPPAGEAAAHEARLRRYVDERLDGAVEALLAERPGFYRRNRVEIWGFLILFTVAAQWLWLVQQSLPKRPLPAAATSAPPAAAPVATPGAAPAAGSATAPAAARPILADWVKSSPLAKAGLEKLLAEEGVAKGTLSSLQRAKASELLSDLKLNRTKNLDYGHLGRLLFEYVVKRAQGPAATGAIDAALNPAEYPPEGLRQLAAGLGVATAPDLDSDVFRHELVIAWLEKNLPR